MNRVQRASAALTRLVRLARVRAVAPGKDDDGLVRTMSSGTDLDKTWEALSQEFTDARESWRRNALARRLVSLVASFVCGDGITVTSDAQDLRAFLDEFWAHEQNRMALRQYGLCEELSRAGELFLTLHMNPADGMSYVRALPASSIDRVITAPGDYETELAYHEMVGLDDPDYPEGRMWYGVAAGAEAARGASKGEASDGEGFGIGREPLPDASPLRGTKPSPWEPSADESSPPRAGYAADAWDPGDAPSPVCLHFAVNRPVGCVRGESDLAPVLVWLRRYARWLEDRTMLNAAVRAFLWVVKVPGTRVEEKKRQWAQAPDPGSVLVLDKDTEDWQAVAPALHANDAQADGRAIRWMIAAGGPGVGLVDLGEAEEANLATAKAMGEQRSKFMRARQQYFGWALATTALTAYNRAVRQGKIAGEPRTLADIRVGLPDISPADNAELGTSANQVAAALTAVSAMGVSGQSWRRLVVRTVLKFAGEPVDEGELARILGNA